MGPIHDNRTSKYILSSKSHTEYISANILLLSQKRVKKVKQDVLIIMHTLCHKVMVERRKNPNVPNEEKNLTKDRKTTDVTAKDDGNVTLQQSSKEQIRGLAACHVI